MNAFGKTLRSFALLVLACQMSLVIGCAAAAPAFLTIEEITGEAAWTRANKPAVKLTEGMSIPIEGMLATGPKSRILLRLPNDALVSLGASSEVELLGYQEISADETPQAEAVAPESPATQTELKLRRGVLTNHVRKLKTGSTYKINTPLGVAGVRGTTFQVRTHDILQSSVVGVHGTISENWVQVVTVATTDGLVGFDTTSGQSVDINAGNAMVAGDPADSGPDGAGHRTRPLTQSEIDEINREVSIFPPKKARYIGGGGQRSPYGLKPTDERLR